MGSFVSDLFRILKSKVLITSIGLFSSVITARFLGPEGNGIISAINIFPLLFMGLGSLGISQSTTYFLGRNIYSEDVIKKTIFQIWIVTSVLALISCFVLIKFFTSSGGNILWVILGILPIPFSLFATYNSGIFLGKNDIKTYNEINWIPPLISFIVVSINLVVFNLGVTGVLIGAFCGPFFMLFILNKKNKIITKDVFQFDKKVFKSLISKGAVYALALFIINMNYKVDVLLLDWLSTTYELGIYSKGASITEYLWQIPMIFSTLIFARSATSKDDKKFSYKVAKLLRVSIIFVGLGSVFLAFFSEDLILLLFGEEYRDSYLVLNYLLPGVLLLTIYKVLNMDLAGKGKPWVSMCAMAPSLLVNIGLNYLLIPLYGAKGSALASTISYIISSIIFVIVYSRVIKIPLKHIFKYEFRDFDFIHRNKFLKK